MKVMVFVGTRPEAVKMAPVFLALKGQPGLEPILVASGQHRDLLGPVLADFGLKADFSLDVMRPGQSLGELSSRLFKDIDGFFRQEMPSAILVQGDTTTVMVAAQCAFYHRIPIGHVEAGLRSGDLQNPYPEEMNRKVVGIVADWHFAPTVQAKENLLGEKVPEKNIIVCGNTVIDAVLHFKRQLSRNPPPLPAKIETAISENRPIILTTCHRRENIGQNLRDICGALRQLADRYPDARIVFPVHPNPLVRDTVFDVLKNHPGVILENPIGYRAFVRLMHESTILLTDSGGLQEEGAALGKPVLVMRTVTERPEAVLAGISKLVGTSTDNIVRQASLLLDDSRAYQSMLNRGNPFGDGFSASRIASFVAERIRTQ